MTFTPRTRRVTKTVAVVLGMAATAVVASMLAIVAVGSPASAADEPDAPDEPVRHLQPLPDPASCGTDASTGHAAPMASLRELKHCARHVSYLASSDVGRSWRVWAKRWRGACRAIPGFEPAGFEAPSYAPAMPAPRHAARWAAKLPDGRGKRTTGAELDAMKRFCVVRRLTPPGPAQPAVDEAVRITAALADPAKKFAVGWATGSDGTPYGGRMAPRGEQMDAVSGPNKHAVAYVDEVLYWRLRGECLDISADGWRAEFGHVVHGTVIHWGAIGAHPDGTVWGIIANASCRLVVAS